MSVVLAIVQIAAAVLLLLPLVIFSVCALRRAGRKIDRILVEECGRDIPRQEARTVRDVRRTTGPAARSTGNSPAR